MAYPTVKLKRSSVVGRVPDSSDLAYGELAVNYNDGKLYYKNSSNIIRSFLDSGQTIALIDSDYINARAAGVIGAANQIVLNQYTGDSSTAAFALSTTPSGDQHVFASINGVLQQTDAYTLTGSTLTFDQAPESGDTIEFRTFRLQTGNVELHDYQNYVYQPAVNTSVFSGPDINSKSLSYIINKLDVYLNGQRLVNGIDYTAFTGTSVTLLGAPADSNDTVSISSFGKAYLLVNPITELDSSTSTHVTTSSNQIVDTFPAVTTRTAKYLIQLDYDSANAYHSTEILLTHDGIDVYMTEYATIVTDSSLGTFDADINAGNVRLLVTPSYNNITVKAKRISIGV